MGILGAVVVVVLSVIGLAVASWLGLLLVGASEARATRRREREVASGWSRSASDPGLPQQFRGGPFAAIGNAEATEVFRGLHRGRAFAAFEYAITLDADQSSRHRYSVVALEVGLVTPEVSVLRTESPVPHFEEADGTDVVVRRAAFADLCRVRSPEPILAEALLHPAAVDGILGRPAVAWRLSDGWLVSITTQRLGPLQVHDTLEVLTVVLDGVPPAIWERFAR